MPSEKENGKNLIELCDNLIELRLLGKETEAEKLIVDAATGIK